MDIFINQELKLTPVENADQEALVHFCNDPELYANTITIPKVYTQQSASDFLELIKKKEQECGFQTQWAIRLNNSGLLIGSIGLVDMGGEPPFKAEIGYWIAAPFRGKGWMTDIVEKFVEFCFDHFKLTRISAKVFSHNPASMRVLEKAGFEKEGVAQKEHLKDGQFLDTVLFATVRQD